MFKIKMSTIWAIFYTLVLGVLLFTTNLNAQEEVQNKPQEVLEMPAAQPEISDDGAKFEIIGEAVEEPVNNKQVIVSEKDKTIKQSLEQYLKTEMGFEAIDQSGNTKSIYFRGVPTRQVIFEVDGVLLGDPSTIENSVDLSIINMSDVETIEIKQFAVGYTSGTPAVLVKLTTNKKKGGTFRQKIILNEEFSFEENDSYFSYNYNLSADLSLKLKTGYRNSVGYPIADVEGARKKGFEITNFGLSAQYLLSEDSELNLLAEKLVDRNDLVNGASQDSHDYRVYSASEKQNLSYISGINQFSVSHNLVSRRYKQSVDSSTDTSDTEDTDATYKASTLLLQNKTQIENLNILVFQKTQRQLESQQNWGYGVSTAEAVAIYEFGAGFESKNYAVSLSKNEKQGDFANAQIAREFAVNDIKSYALINYKSFAASLVQLTDPFSGNADLKPESSVGFEMGFGSIVNNDFEKEEDINHSQFKFIYNRHWSLIDYDLSLNRYQNLNDAIAAGFEFLNKLKKSAHVLTSSIQYLPIRFAKNDKMLPGRSLYKLVFDYSYYWSDRWLSSFELNYFSERFTDVANSKKLDAYELINLLIDYKFAEKQKMSFAIKNLSNKDYTIAEGYNTKDIHYIFMYEFLFN